MRSTGSSGWPCPQGIDAISSRAPGAVLPRAGESRVSAFGRARRRLALACMVVALAGICLAGTGLVAPATGRSIRVHNYGGLDWERPVFGRFGGFGAGMFGLFPVYCRAEGYDFGVIEHIEKHRSASVRRPPPVSLPALKRPMARVEKREPEVSATSKASARDGEPAGAVASAALASAFTPAVDGDDSLRHTDVIEPADLAHPNPGPHQLAQGMERRRSPRRS